MALAVHLHLIGLPGLLRGTSCFTCRDVAQSAHDDHHRRGTGKRHGGAGLSMALGMIVTVSRFALAVLLSRRVLLDLLMRDASHARALEVRGATAVTVIRLLPFSGEIV